MLDDKSYKTLWDGGENTFSGITIILMVTWIMSDLTRTKFTLSLVISTLMAGAFASKTSMEELGMVPCNTLAEHLGGFAGLAQVL